MTLRGIGPCPTERFGRFVARPPVRGTGRVCDVRIRRGSTAGRDDVRTARDRPRVARETRESGCDDVATDSTDSPRGQRGDRHTRECTGIYAPMPSEDLTGLPVDEQTDDW
ncbi:hypothetical protein DMJ13_15495 [halophilic archaeon]|nr:hypothetical protein DMJ13_15495 [halophilic archaeon]